MTNIRISIKRKRSSVLNHRGFKILPLSVFSSQGILVQNNLPPDYPDQYELTGFTLIKIVQI